MLAGGLRATRHFVLSNQSARSLEVSFSLLQHQSRSLAVSVPPPDLHDSRLQGLHGKVLTPHRLVPSARCSLAFLPTLDRYPIPCGHDNGALLFSSLAKTHDLQPVPSFRNYLFDRITKPTHPWPLSASRGRFSRLTLGLHDPAASHIHLAACRALAPSNIMLANRGFDDSQNSGNRNAPTHLSQYIWWLLGVAVLFGCHYLYCQEPIPVLGGHHYVFGSLKNEIQLGIDGAHSIKSNYSHNILHPTDKIHRTIQRIGCTLISVSGLSDALDWKLYVVDRPEVVNACVLPDGTIFVFTGLFKVCKTREAIAAVLAHEISHVIARHSGSSMSVAKLIYFALQIARFTLPLPMPPALLSVLCNMAIALPSSRRHELEADLLGAHLLAHAQIDPQNIVVLLTNLGQAVAGDSENASSTQKLFLELLQTHPLSENRVSQIEAHMDSLINLYFQIRERYGKHAPFFAPLPPASVLGRKLICVDPFLKQSAITLPSGFVARYKIARQKLEVLDGTT